MLKEGQDGKKDPRRLRWELIILGMMYAGYAALMLCRNTLIASSTAFIADPSLGFDKAKYGRLMSWRMETSVGPSSCTPGLAPT